MNSNRKAKSRALMDKIVRAPYTYLFINIIAIFLLTPFGEQKPQMIPIVETAFFSMLLLVLWALRMGKGVMAFFVTMILLSIASDFFLFHQGLHSIYFKLITPFVDCLLVLSVIVILLRTIFQQRKVSSDTLLGGITVYFLLGILWTFFTGSY